MARDSYVTINGDALRHNLQRVRDFAPHSKILAMVKSNAYGHGMVQVAQALKNADALGVAFLQEALVLREAGIQQDILLLQGFLSEDELPLIIQHQLNIVVHAEWQLAILEHTSLNKPLKVWLKIDSGMHRAGFLPADVSSVWQRLQHCKNVQQPPVLMTHFARADEITQTMTDEQLACFIQCTENLPGERSLANSAAVVTWPQSHADWVRPGIMLYGASPVGHLSAKQLDLQPVMTVSAKLIAIKQLKKGESVGYGARWICPEDMPLGVVALGYGDGYPRQAQQGTPVLVKGQRCAIAGTVSMDMITIDLRAAPTAKIGDQVIFWGDDLPVDEIAKAANTITYELLTHVNANQRMDVLYHYCD